MGSNYSKERKQKGFSQLDFPDEYVCVDLETTGFSPEYDEIIEIAAVKVQNCKVVDTFVSFVKPKHEIDEYIQKLTGITNDILCDAPTIHNVLPKFMDFVGNHIVVGHNVNFDINFIYDNYLSIYEKYFCNNYIDTRRLSRILCPELYRYKLKDLIKFFNVDVQPLHRATSDCHATINVFDCLKKTAVEKYGSVDKFKDVYYVSRTHSRKKVDLTSLTVQITDVDNENPFYGKNVVFTGALERMQRKDAAQLIVNLGGFAQNDLTKQTDYLIIGNYDYCKSIKDGKSSKHKKAENFNLKGCEINIIPENVFYDMVFQDDSNEESETVENEQVEFSGVLLTRDESLAIGMLKEFFEEKGLDISNYIICERRTDKYLTVKTINNFDFLRVKFGVQSKWFSLDFWCLPENLKEDIRLSDVKNKNQRHWRIDINSVGDMRNYLDLILNSFVYSIKRK